MSTQATQETISAPEASALAQEAWLFGMPLVYIEIQIDTMTHVAKREGTHAPINQFVHYRELADASNKAVVGFNVDTLYSLAQLDLSPEPMVLSVPQMGDRFWIMQIIDAWNNVPHAPGSRTVGEKVATSPSWVLPGKEHSLKTLQNYVCLRTLRCSVGARTQAALMITPRFMRCKTSTNWCRFPNGAKSTLHLTTCRSKREWILRRSFRSRCWQ